MIISRRIAALLALVWFATTTTAATATRSTQHVSTYSNPAVPTGTPVAGDYNGALRPRVHFSPPQRFMNDPNGMFRDANGTWHVYYQYNPTDTTAGNQHWGHATSPDLLRWTNQPIALFPPEETVYVFSGSCVVDVNNTSGLFAAGKTDGVVAVFTLARYGDDGSAGPQTQALAYSDDGGYSFQYYDGNPVIDSDSNQFRDPKVIWYEDHWVMVIAYAQEFVVGVYTSPDLKTWTHASNFSRHGLLGAQWECPNLVKVPVRDAVGGSITGEAWVMVISVQPGAPQGGSATQYFPGRFNGTHFEPLDGSARLLDFGKDNYAGQFFYGLEDGRENAVIMAWASNWQYAQQVPTGEAEGWRGGLTLARESYLANATRNQWVMVQVVSDLTPVLAGGQPLSTTVFEGDDVKQAGSSTDLSSLESGAVYIDTNVTGLSMGGVTGNSSISFTLSSPVSGESLRWGFFFGGDMNFYVDRGGASGAFADNVFFTDKFSIADVWNSSAGATWRLQAVADRSLLELFVDGGVHAATVLYYPTEPLSVFSVRVQGLPEGSRADVALWGLDSVW